MIPTMWPASPSPKACAARSSPMAVNAVTSTRGEGAAAVTGSELRQANVPAAITISRSTAAAARAARRGPLRAARVGASVVVRSIRR